jgi:anthranilate/para-aminobenzoate synthase component II
LHSFTLAANTRSTQLVDNYDSYTYKAAQLIDAICARSRTATRNDTISWKALSR